MQAQSNHTSSEQQATLLAQKEVALDTQDLKESTASALVPKGRVAVIGAGPAGLSCALELLKRGLRSHP